MSKREWYPIEKFFCDRLYELHSKKKISAREMSLSLGHGPGYINNIENRKSLPSMSTFFNICDYLGVTPAEFFQTDNPNPPRLNELVDNLKQLDDDQLEHLNAIVKDMKRN